MANPDNPADLRLGEHDPRAVSPPGPQAAGLGLTAPAGEIGGPRFAFTGAEATAEAGQLTTGGVPILDENGNAILDENGNQILSEGAPLHEREPAGALSGAFDPKAFEGRAFDTAPQRDAGAAPQTIEAIQRALAARPIPIRDAARALAGALKAQAVELQHVKPNEASKLEEHESLINFIYETSGGLQELADTIDSAIQDAQSRHEPVLLGKAAEIANRVHARALEWLLANSATVFEGAFRVGLFGLGMAFVSVLGIELSPSVTAAIATLAGTVGKAKPPDAK